MKVRSNKILDRVEKRWNEQNGVPGKSSDVKYNGGFLRLRDGVASGGVSLGGGEAAISAGGSNVGANSSDKSNNGSETTPDPYRFFIHYIEDPNSDDLNDDDDDDGEIKTASGLMITEEKVRDFGDWKEESAGGDFSGTSTGANVEVGKVKAYSCFSDDNKTNDWWGVKEPEDWMVSADKLKNWIENGVRSDTWGVSGIGINGNGSAGDGVRGSIVQGGDSNFWQQKGRQKVQQQPPHHQPHHNPQHNNW